jgi:hypothetical protein
MKKTTWIALGVLAALIGVYFVVKDEPVKEVESPLVIEPVSDLQRIEIVPPDSDDDAARPDLIVFAKQDAAWRLVRPVESDLEPSFARKLDEVFSETIETDDFALSADKKDEYKLTDRAGFRLALFSKGSDTPAVELVVGDQITVPETGVKRTYIRKVGDDELYRARVALGDLVRTPLDDVRSRTILDVPTDSIGSVRITHPEETVVRLARDKTDWTLSRNGEPVDFELDDGRVQSAVRTLARLEAAGFLDPGETDANGRPDPTHTVEIEVGDETHTLGVGQSGGKEPTVFVERDDRPFAYEVDARAEHVLTADAAYFRTRTPRPIARDSIERVRFRGDATIVLEKTDDGWTMSRPKSDDFNAAKAGSLVSTLSKLRVHGYPPVEAQPDLGQAVGRVSVETADARHQLTLGQQATTKDGVELHLARFDDGPVFYVKKSMVDLLTPAVDDLEGQSKPQMPSGGVPKGLPQNISKGLEVPGGGGR